MDIALKETYERLKELSHSFKAKRNAEIVLKKSEENYIKENIRCKKPEIKYISNMKKPISKPKVGKYMLIAFSIALPLCLIGIAIGVYDVILLFSFGGVAIGVGTALAYYCPKLKRYYDDCKMYEKSLVEDEKIKSYNDMVPALLEKYNNEVSRLRECYREQYNENKVKLANAEEIIKKYSGIISPKFYDSIDDIIEILEDGRADSLKEAINLFVSDSRQKDLVREQQKMNEIAEQQMWDAQRHNREMEAQARRQADAVKQQEEARRRGAPNCWQCKNWPCGGDPAYCGSFAKKK